MTYRPHYETLTEPVAVGSAERPGQYPPENVPVDVGGVELGPGRVRYLEHHDGTVTEIPLAWSTIEPVDDAYRRWLALVRVFSDTGLWPIVGDLGYGTTPPWAQHHHWKREPLPARPNKIDRVLAEAWELVEDDEGQRDLALASTTTKYVSEDFDELVVRDRFFVRELLAECREHFRWRSGEVRSGGEDRLRELRRHVHVAQCRVEILTSIVEFFDDRL